jgi:hypothetical protein
MEHMGERLPLSPSWLYNCSFSYHCSSYCEMKEDERRERRMQKERKKQGGEEGK